MMEYLSWFMFISISGFYLAYGSKENLKCVANDDCTTDRVCSNQECVDPCPGVCGNNTVCNVTNHVPMCSSSPGHSGNPDMGCSDSPDLFRHSSCFGHNQCPNSMACILGNCSNPCEALCGYNTSCTVFNHVPACACKEGHKGNPFLGCSPQDIFECVSNEDCATDKACAKQQCVDPCAGVCGNNTICQVINHVAMCSCSPGHSGHPILGCSASTEVRGDLGCSGHDQCPASKACVLGKCISPCEILCGNNTVCNVIHHVPDCACKEGYTGNPLTGCAPQETRKVRAPKTGKKKFYVQNSIKADWQEAFMLCLSNNSRLATIDNENEFQEIQKLLANHGGDSYWTSGSDSGIDGKFMWATTGRHCIELLLKRNIEGYGLNDGDCKYKCHPVCEYYE